jgi:hypothetical protein
MAREGRAAAVGTRDGKQADTTAVDTGGEHKQEEATAMARGGRAAAAVLACGRCRPRLRRLVLLSCCSEGHPTDATAVDT